MKTTARYTRHKQDQRLFNRFLADAGWEVDPIRSETADLEYENENDAKLRVVLATSTPSFNFSVEEGDDEALVHVNYGDDPRRALQKLVELQDRFSLATMDELLEELHPETREIHVYVNEELVPIYEAAENLEREKDDPLGVVKRVLEGAGWSTKDDRSWELRAHLAFRVLFAKRKDADEDDAIYLLFGRVAPRQIALIIYPGDRLSDLLQLIVTRAKKVTAQAYDQLLSELVHEFPQTFLYEAGKASLLGDGPRPKLPKN